MINQKRQGNTVSDVTKYQLYSDYFKLILQIKKQMDGVGYLQVVEKALEKFKGKNIDQEDMEFLKDFLINLSDEGFQDNCMNAFIRLKKYDDGDDKLIPNLEFLKLQYYHFLIK